MANTKQKKKLNQSDKKEKPAKFNAADHWKGMPEFNQPGIIPIKTILVHFETKDNMLAFSKIVGVEITAKSKSIWYPPHEQESYIDKRWSDKKVKV